MRRETNHAHLVSDLLADDIAEDAAALVFEVVAALDQLASDVIEDDRHRHHP